MAEDESQKKSPDAASQQPAAELERLGVVAEVPITLSIEVGRLVLPFRAAMRQLVDGNVLRLDRRPDDPVEIYANGALVARGQIVLVNDELAVRVQEITDESGG